MTKAYRATVTIVIDPKAWGVDSETHAYEWFSELLSNNPEVLDWGHTPPYNLTEINIPDDYEEGDFLLDLGSLGLASTKTQ